MARKDEEKKTAEKAEEKKAPAKKTAARAKKETEVKVEKKQPTRKEAKAKEESAGAEPVKDLKDLGGAVTAEAKKPAVAAEKVAEQPKERVQKLDAQGRAYATGRRKGAIARVWIKPGKGQVIVNGKDQAVYFGRQTQRLVLNQPFLIVDRVGQFDVMCSVVGGGLSGQAGAVRHGISRALENYDPALRPALKKAGMLTRDARIVERKKIGKHKARRSKQWAKR